MSLKQMNPVDRIIFLKRFSAELMVNAEEQKPSKQITIEKLRRKFLQPLDSEKTFEKSISSSFFQKPIYPRRELKKVQSFLQRKQIPHRFQIPEKPPQIQKQITKPAPQMQKPRISPAQRIAEIKPEPRARPEGFALGELEPLLKDPSIQSIESPGPGRNVLVKKYNKINVTKTTLGQTEITKVINSFSEKARIPIVGGILKAAVGNLVISAVISEFVGSRFIINKMTPYSLIEKR